MRVYTTPEKKEKVVYRNSRRFNELKEHPFVEEWRRVPKNTDTSFYKIYVEIGSSSGASFKEVYKVIFDYKRTLRRLVSSSIKRDLQFNVRRGVMYYKDTLSLNEAESRFIINQVYN
jgi:hypothetical protein